VTSTESVQFFRKLFLALSGIDSGAYAWQEELFKRFNEGDLPGELCLPTGLGKTSVMHVWLLALAWGALQTTGKKTVPRRLVWVVDRRVVVDQATTEAERLAGRIQEEPSCRELCQALRGLAIGGGSGRVLAVSTLRGEFADNREWSEDPSRPAIIVGTVDMVGSRLLFSGYGDSRRRRALHAGLLGHDALIVNDEAHLTVAFAHLLGQIRHLAGGPASLVSMRLSATPRDQQGPAFPETLEVDLKNGEFRKRYCASKRLHLVETDEPKKEIYRLAAEAERRTIVFVRSPEEARKVATSITGKHNGARVPLITGVQRGYERDQLREDPVVRRYFQKEPPALDSEPCWLVSTSAGEVGIDLSADRLITDLDTADHLLQRFGRLNRFGETQGDAYVVYSRKQTAGDKGKALRTTLEYLEALPDVSPETLRAQLPPQDALSAAPHFGPLLPWHVDVWSMTSISSQDWPSRPAVEYWLRGDDEEGSPPETYVAWREDVRDLANPGVSAADREDVFECYPVVAQERLKQYTRELREALAEPGYRSEAAILISADGEVHTGTLGELLDHWPFDYGTLVLPPGVGHLDQNGMVDWSKATGALTEVELARYDVSETGTETGKRMRVRLNPEGAEAETGLRRRCCFRIPMDDETDEGPRWVYFAGEPRPRTSGSKEEFLDVHQDRVAGVAAGLARKLVGDERTVRVFEWAGQWHDSGKDRDIWQRAVGNSDRSRPVAKCARLNGRQLAGYRHELGSLLDAEEKAPEDFTEAERDLGLHLIAGHHGWGRPHFAEPAFDKEAFRRSERMALECARRFGRLQRIHGAWGLAYLEAIFRSADAIASASSPELPPNA